MMVSSFGRDSMRCSIFLVFPLALFAFSLLLPPPRIVLTGVPWS